MPNMMGQEKRFELLSEEKDQGELDLRLSNADMKEGRICYHLI